MGPDMWTEFESVTSEFAAWGLIRYEDDPDAPSMVDVRNHMGGFDQSAAAQKEALAEDAGDRNIKANESQRNEWKSEARIRGGRWLVTVSEGITRERIQGMLRGSKKIQNTVGLDEEHAHASSVIEKFQTKNVGHRQKAASFQAITEKAV